MAERVSAEVVNSDEDATNDVRMITVIVQLDAHWGQRGWTRNMLRISKSTTGWQLKEQYAESQDVDTREMEFKVRLATRGLRGLEKTRD